MTDYTLYLAATTTEETYYGEILTVNFSTSDFEEDVTLVDTYYDGFSIHVKMPESVKQAGNVLRYTYGNLVMYNTNKSGWMATSDASMLEANGGQYMEDSQTITYNDENAYYVDEFGEEVVLHDPIVPGEPVVFFAGEFGWGESMYGWGEGWYAARFDEAAYQDALWGGTGEVNEDDFWSGYFYKTKFTVREPEVLDATVDVDCSNVQAVTGTIKFTPDDEVLQYCVVVTDETSYQMVLDYLDGNKDYLQWFTTSYYASFMLGMRTFQGNTEIDLTDYLYLQEQSHYHVLVTAMGDEEGMTQSFRHVEFDTTEKTMEAPVVTVTAVENTDKPFEVSFNVKNTGNVEVASATYAANYERDWAAALQYMTYADIERQWSRKLKTVLLFSRQEWSPSHGAEDGTYVSNIFVGDITYKFDRKKSLRAEIQYLLSGDYEGDWAAALLEFSFAPKWSIFASDMYNLEGTKKNYYNAGFSYTKGKTRIQLSYGRNRAGYICSGGVCRYSPAYTGLNLALTTSF